MIIKIVNYISKIRTHKFGLSRKKIITYYLKHSKYNRVTRKLYVFYKNKINEASTVCTRNINKCIYFLHKD